MSISPGLSVADEDSPINPCISCHDTVTPGVVIQWQESKHSKVGVKCYVCHKARDDDPSGMEHNGFTVTAIVSPRYCQSCHALQVQQHREGLHDEAGLFSLSAYAVVDGEKVDGNVTYRQTATYKLSVADNNGDLTKDSKWIMQSDKDKLSMRIFQQNTIHGQVFESKQLGLDILMKITELVGRDLKTRSLLNGLSDDEKEKILKQI